ncbi:MAG: aminotransferase class III-fold pyridoxal phosphate-dependent enzyme [Patescibacteria group bacterium]
MPENTSQSFSDYLKRAQERLLILPGATTVYSRGEGAYVYDRDGRRLLDGNARAGQVSFGHNNPLIHETDQKMREAGAQCFETIGDFWQTEIKVNGVHYEISPPALAELLVSLTYGSDAYVVPQVSGTLATNSLIKICERLRPDRRIFVSFDGAYHGRSGAALSLTNARGIQKHRNAPGLQVAHIPFVATAEDAEQAVAVLTRIDPSYINAAFFEGVQSVGGMRSQSPEHVMSVLKFLQNAGALIFTDEIYSGFHRTGKRFSFQYYDFVPDGIAMAKVIGQGLPISAAIVQKGIFEREGKDAREVCPIGWEGGTFNWASLPVARGIVGLSHYEKENIGGHVAAMAEYFDEKAGAVLRVFNHGRAEPIAHLTGRGLMRGFCFRAGKKPLPKLRDAVGAEMFKEGVIFTGAGHEAINPTLIFTPPLIIEKTHIDEFAAALEPSLARAWASVGLE